MWNSRNKIVVYTKGREEALMMSQLEEEQREEDFRRKKATLEEKEHEKKKKNESEAFIDELVIMFTVFLLRYDLFFCKN